MNKKFKLVSLAKSKSKQIPLLPKKSIIRYMNKCTMVIKENKKGVQYRTAQEIIKSLCQIHSYSFVDFLKDNISHGRNIATTRRFKKFYNHSSLNWIQIIKQLYQQIVIDGHLQNYLKQQETKQEIIKKHKKLHQLHVEHQKEIKHQQKIQRIKQAYCRNQKRIKNTMKHLTKGCKKQVINELKFINE